MSKRTFPCKLLALMKTHPHVVQWNVTGDTIHVNFEEVQKLLEFDVPFKTKNIQSFVRNLNLYGFRMVTTKNLDPNVKTYFHLYFNKNNPSLVEKITRNGIPEKEDFERGYYGSIKREIKEEIKEEPGVENAFRRYPARQRKKTTVYDDNEVIEPKRVKQSTRKKKPSPKKTKKKVKMEFPEEEFVHTKQKYIQIKENTIQSLPYKAVSIKEEPIEDSEICEIMDEIPIVTRNIKKEVVRICKKSESEQSAPTQSVFNGVQPKHRVSVKPVSKPSTPVWSIHKQSTSIQSDPDPRWLASKQQISLQVVPVESIHKQFLPRWNGHAQTVSPQSSCVQIPVKLVSEQRESVQPLPVGSVSKQRVAAHSVLKQTVPAQSVSVKYVHESVSRRNAPEQSVSAQSFSNSELPLCSVPMQQMRVRSMPKHPTSKLAVTSQAVLSNGDFEWSESIPSDDSEPCGNWSWDDVLVKNKPLPSYPTSDVKQTNVIQSCALSGTEEPAPQQVPPSKIVHTHQQPKSQNLQRSKRLQKLQPSTSEENGKYVEENTNQIIRNKQKQTATKDPTEHTADDDDDDDDGISDSSYDSDFEPFLSIPESERNFKHTKQNLKLFRLRRKSDMCFVKFKYLKDIGCGIDPNEVLPYPN